ncbi:MAG TPA: TIGR03435 family protein [Gemmatimonadaceae bacterium]|nr:TIGR03435 family protein [Gemmatimonadaceae bacterium]
MRLGSGALSLGTLVTAAAVVVLAQSEPRFEVASVKPNRSGERTGPNVRYEGSQFVAVNDNLLTILRTAWRLPADQVVGGPDWVRSERERFDIFAKAPEGATRAQMPLMVRALLADRYTLETHFETRQVPMYALVVARRDGRLGPRLVPTSNDCKARLAARQRGDAGAPPEPETERPACGLQSSLGNIHGAGAEIAEFVRVLSFLDFAGRPVIDRTGLTGEYQIDLQWTTDRTRTDPEFPTLSTALREQLGLTLDATKGPADFLVIDSAQRPTPD